VHYPENQFGDGQIPAPLSAELSKILRRVAFGLGI
jgi:hypothetical protein